MWSFSSTERALLARIKDDTLTNSLSNLRGGMESLWSADAPRLIQDFTDHGPAHTRRLVDYATKLLEANGGPPLGDEELYLLLGGIYLHDIGMQCDLAKFPSLRDEAEHLGAVFDVQFEARRSSAYSIDEQIALRANHSFVAAACIDRAYRLGEGPLADKVKSIPASLVRDVMDVCMFHSGLDIADCPQTSEHTPGVRTKLVASIVRFADELDISDKRVNFEVVKNFNMQPESLLHWWLHSRTKVHFENPNRIRFQIALRPDDLSRYRSVIYGAFFVRFEEKNRTVLSVLNSNGFALDGMSDSRLVENPYVSKVPPEVAEILDDLLSQRTADPSHRVRELEDELRQVEEQFQLLTAELAEKTGMLAEADRKIDECERRRLASEAAVGRLRSEMAEARGLPESATSLLLQAEQESAELRVAFRDAQADLHSARMEVAETKRQLGECQSRQLVPPVPDGHGEAKALALVAQLKSLLVEVNQRQNREHTLFGGPTAETVAEIARLKFELKQVRSRIKQR